MFCPTLTKDYYVASLRRSGINGNSLRKSILQKSSSSLLFGEVELMETPRGGLLRVVVLQSLLFGEVELMETTNPARARTIPILSLLFGEVELMETRWSEILHRPTV